MGASDRLRQFFRREPTAAEAGGRGRPGRGAVRPGRRAVRRAGHKWWAFLAAAGVALGTTGGPGAQQSLAAQRAPAYNGPRIQLTAVDAERHGPMTRHSRYIQSFHERYGDAFDGVRVVMLDPDRLTMAVRRSWQPGYRGTTLPPLVAAYIRSQIHGSPHQGPGNTFDAIIERLREGRGGSWRWATPQFSPQRLNHDIRQICIVTPTDADSSARWDLSILTGIKPEMLAGPGGEFPLGLTKNETQRFIDYHNFTQALDLEFAKEASASSGFRKIMATHRAVITADIHAALMLTVEGHTDIAGRLAEMRKLTAFAQGRIDAEAFPYADQIRHYSRALYSSWGALEATQAWIDRHGADAVRAMSPEQRLDFSQQVAREHGFTSMEMKIVIADINGKAYEYTSFDSDKVSDEFARDARRFLKALERAEHGAFERYARGAPEDALAWADDREELKDKFHADRGWDAPIERVVEAMGGRFHDLEKAVALWRDRARARIQAENGPYSDLTRTLNHAQRKLGTNKSSGLAPNVDGPDPQQQTTQQQTTQARHDEPAPRSPGGP